MAKTMSRQETKQSPEGTKKQRKKQAKREAKAMLQLEKTRQDVEKAEQKVAKAQAQLKESRKRLRNLETEIEEIRAPQHHSDAGEATTRTPSQEQPQADKENHADISTPANQVISLLPAEDRTDGSQGQEDTSSSAEQNTDGSQGQETISTASENDQTDDADTDEEDAHTRQGTRRPARRRRTSTSGTGAEEEKTNQS